MYASTRTGASILPPRRGPAVLSLSPPTSPPPSSPRRGVTAPVTAAPPTFAVPQRATQRQLQTVLAAALAPPGGAPSAWGAALRGDAPAVAVGKHVPTSGVLGGHCAYACLVRSSGAPSMAPPDEKALVMALRRLAALHVGVRLLTEPDLHPLMAASMAAEHGGGGSGVAAYLAGQLSPVALTAAQYAGSLELGALAERLRRVVCVLCEAGSGDVGGAFHPSGSTPGAPPLCMVNTRRQHTFPLVVGGAGSAPLTLRGVEAACASAVGELDALLLAREGARGGPAYDAVRAVAGALRGGGRSGGARWSGCMVTQRAHA